MEPLLFIIIMMIVINETLAYYVYVLMLAGLNAVGAVWAVLIHLQPTDHPAEKS